MFFRILGSRPGRPAHLRDGEEGEDGDARKQSKVERLKQWGKRK